LYSNLRRLLLPHFRTVNTMRKGVIYVRVSDPGQVSGTSLDNQERACLEYTARNGIEVVRVFIEKGESATAANRTEFLKALEFCRAHKGELHSFIVWKIDRFARNTNDHFSVRAKLTQYGVVLMSVTEPITQDPIGKLMETFLAGYAEFENEVRKQRCTGGMQARLREGIWCWWPPIGYIHSKRIKDRRKTEPDIPDEKRFNLIQRGLRLYQTGNYTLAALAEESNRWGLRTRTGKPTRKQLWENILTNKFYAGILVDPWTGEEYPGRHTPMITRQDYDKIQAIKRMMSSNATGRRFTTNPDFPLRRFVLCECGIPYTASWINGRNKKYPFYHCHNRQCEHFGRTVARDTLETKFYEFLRGVSPSPEFLELFKQTVIDYLHEQTIAGKREKERHQSELVKLESRRKELMDMRINKEISSEEYKEMKSTLEGQIASLATSDIGGGVGYSIETAASRAMELIKNVADEWKSMSSPYKQRLQRVVLPKDITYRKLDGTFGTAILSPIFRLNEEFRYAPSGLVAAIRQNWSQILLDISNLYELAAESHAIN
jgi:site-specific DNA recombinase